MNLRVKDTFAAAHRLDGYDGDCANVHGHTWGVEVLVDVTGLYQKAIDPDMVDGAPGLSADFKVVKAALKKVLPDHAMINEVLPFNPTAENIAAWLGAELDRALNTALPEPGVAVLEVVVWESERAAAIATREVDF